MIGDLNKRIVIQYPTRASDSMGGFIATWIDSDTIWAAIWPTSAGELVQSMQTNMAISHRIRVRYRSDITSAYRIKFGNRYFNIVSMINPNEKGEWLDILCKEAT